MARKFESALVAFGLCATLTSPAFADTRDGCRSFSFPVYFEPNSAELTQAADRAIKAAGPRMADCKVNAVTIQTRADGRNVELNQRRAEIVSAALSEAGAPQNLVKIEMRKFALGIFQRRITVSIGISN